MCRGGDTYKLRIAGSQQMLEEAKKNPVAELAAAQPCRHLDSRLLISNYQKIKFCCFEPFCFVRVQGSWYFQQANLSAALCFTLLRWPREAAQAHLKCVPLLQSPRVWS